ATVTGVQTCALPILTMRPMGVQPYGLPTPPGGTMSTYTPIESVWSPSLRTWTTMFLASAVPSLRTTLLDVEIFFSLASWTPGDGDRKSTRLNSSHGS